VREEMMLSEQLHAPLADGEDGHAAIIMQ
jgi:hypothetical protein